MSVSTIKSVQAYQMMGRQNPMIGARVITQNGSLGMAICTAGVSVGKHEVEFSYDGGKKWNGLGVTNAVREVNEKIAPKIIGMDAADQFLIDHTMLNIDGVGGNSIAAVSAAVLKAAAKALDIPLYRHIGGDRAVTLPTAAFGAVGGSNRYEKMLNVGAKPTYSFVAHDFPTFSQASYALWEVVTAWQEQMKKKYGLHAFKSSAYATTAGFVYVPPGIVKNERELWQMLNEVIAKAGYENKIGLQVDIAGECFYNQETKLYENIFEPGGVDRDGMIAIVQEMADKYSFVIVEDPLLEDDFEGHAMMTRAVDIQIVGDDLFTTNTERLKQGIEVGAANCVLLKVNQIGTITQSLEMIQLAYENGYGVMPCSSRGEGIDIVDYSVGINAGTIRETGLGSAANRFLAIEKELGANAVFAGSAGIKGRKFQK